MVLISSNLVNIAKMFTLPCLNRKYISLLGRPKNKIVVLPLVKVKMVGLQVNILAFKSFHNYKNWVHFPPFPQKGKRKPHKKQNKIKNKQTNKTKQKNKQKNKQTNKPNKKPNNLNKIGCISDYFVVVYLSV